MGEQIDVSQLRPTFPWQSQVFGNGLVRVVDRTGAEVPLFTMLGFIESVTVKMSQQDEKKAEAQATA